MTATGTLSWAAGNTAPKTFTVAITDDAAVEGNETFTVALSAPTGGAAIGSPTTGTVTIVDNDTSPPPLPPPPPPPSPTGGQPFAVGTDAGTVGRVTMYNPDGTVRFTATSFGTAYTGGVLVATGDVTGDGIADIAVGSG